MVSSATSLKELSKAIVAFIASPALPLPTALTDSIAVYLRRHEKYDDAASDRLQEELMAIFDKHVKSYPMASGAWIAILRRLLPALQTPQRVLPWFDACKGFLDRSGLDKLSVDETISALMDLIAVTDDYQFPKSADAGTNPVMDRLFFIWTKRFYPALVEGNTDQEHNETLVRQALTAYGKKKPRDFFTSMDTCLVKKQHRGATLRFLCDFIQHQPPHLHQILHTPLFSNLLACLQYDTSTSIISSALTALIMLLPHMPSSLVSYLPTLFNIYTRLLFWDRQDWRAADDGDRPRSWELCSYDPAMDDFPIAQLPNYYTILYGLYPINLMDYIRKPQRYLRHANMSNPNDIEVQPTEIRHRSERFRRCHFLHPNFYTLTIDSEKTDFGRWIKSEAAEVLVDCMALCHTNEWRQTAQDAGPPPMPGFATSSEPSSKSDVALGPLWSGNMDSWQASSRKSIDTGPMRRVSQSSQPLSRHSTDLCPTTGSGVDVPTRNGSQLTLSSSHSQLQDMIHSNKVIKSGLHQSLANDSSTSLALSISNQEGAGGPMDQTAQLSHLQRRVLVLENDLSFERFSKQQHMAHIGELRRRLVAEAATEAETQNLIMMNRNLKIRFEDAKKAHMQVRQDSEKGRALANKRQAEMANKFRNLKDESKITAAELGAVRRELSECKQERDQLRKLVCDAEVKDLAWKQKMQLIEGQGAEVDRLKAQITELTKSERDHQAQELERRRAIKSAADAGARVEAMRLELVAQQHDARRWEKQLRDQVNELQAQLAESHVERERPGGRGDIAVEGALAASRAKQAELQKQYKLLVRKYTALQSSLLDMQSEAGESMTKHNNGGEQANDSPPTPTSGKTGRRRRSGSNTDAGTASSQPAPSGDGPGSSSSEQRQLSAGE
ncbi:hypothetical protein CDD81_4210 [Ophiocordyceps australis]|uniref:Tuberous sclerosis 1 n=1 Tax=Ophiocordyceps australis TaxID=1399860 RepID=A0A2C5XAH1_9HYPO|nr:hypothetical protein CDD81_4210 [Ophiocordyceps australis]